MNVSNSNRIIVTPSAYAREHFWYVQEIGTLQSIEPHISSRKELHSYLFLMVLDGAGKITYQGSSYTVHAGDCAFIDCNKPYSHTSDKEHQWRLMWVHFYGLNIAEFYSYFEETESKPIFSPDSLTIFEELLSKLYELQSQKKNFQELESHRLLTDLVTLCHTVQAEDKIESYALSDKLQNIRSYLDEHYAGKLTLDSISAHFFISKFYLSREYKKAFGITLQNDLTAKRISHAKSMLRFSNASIEEISRNCGFSTASYFTKVFRTEENMTPMTYRRKW